MKLSDKHFIQSMQLYESILGEASCKRFKSITVDNTNQILNKKLH